MVQKFIFAGNNFNYEFFFFGISRNKDYFFSLMLKDFNIMDILKYIVSFNVKIINFISNHVHLYHGKWSTLFRFNIIVNVDLKVLFELNFKFEIRAIILNFTFIKIFSCEVHDFYDVLFLFDICILIFFCIALDQKYFVLFIAEHLSSI